MKAYLSSPALRPSAVSSITSCLPPATGDKIRPTTKEFKEASLSVTTR
jgi:hypothetical protein